MQLTFLLILGLTFTSLASCQSSKNITLHVNLVDIESQKTVPDAEILIISYSDSYLREKNYEEYHLRSNNKGSLTFSCSPNKKIAIACASKNFNPVRIFYDHINVDTQIIIKLYHIQKNESLKTVFFYNHPELVSNEKTPFLKIRTYYQFSNESSMKLETFGFDFKKMISISDTNLADVWFRPLKNKFIVAGNMKGGIIPITNSQIKSSLLFEDNFAPSTGYVNHYELTGSEEGFFVLCRDGKTYAKIILEKITTEENIPQDSDQYYIDRGKKFSAFYQPSGSRNLRYSKSDVDLKTFLLSSDYK